MADVGFGLEMPARQFRLDFIPLAMERCFLVCDTALLDTPPMRALLEVVREPAFHAQLNALPGYEAMHTGRVLPLREAFDTASSGPP